MTNWPWEKIKSATTILGTPLRCTESDCAVAASQIGLSQLPRSYIEYAAFFGAGQWEPDLTIVAPKHKYPALTLKHRAAASKEGLQETRDDYPDSLKPVLHRLVSFGWWANGYELCWDTGRALNDEFELCILTHDDSKITYCGTSLNDFIGNYWINGKIDTVHPRPGMSWNPRSQFSVLDEG